MSLYPVSESHSYHHSRNAVTPSSRRTSISFPFPFPWRSPANLSSTSLVTSSAEGKAIPVDDSTAESRTSALRRLHQDNPRRHRYSKSTGAQNTTFSEPIIVRTYAPKPDRPKSATESGIIIVNKGPVPRPHRRPVSFAGRAREGMLDSMARMTGGKRNEGRNANSQPTLPPLEAFTFKSFLENSHMEAEGADINADLDRIAEICARSRYSLSSQHDAHYGPHGSGDAFIGPAAQSKDASILTLQVVSPGDEEHSTRGQRRRHGARRISRAVGTLETIISGSRSSEEDKAPKKSAAELAEGVRERAIQSASFSPRTDQEAAQSAEERAQPQHAAPATRRRASSSLALIDTSRQSRSTSQPSPQNPRASLICEPSQPMTCNTLSVTSTAETSSPDTHTRKNHAVMANLQSKSAPSEQGSRPARVSFTSWMPWATGENATMGARAEGKLKELLDQHPSTGRGKE